MASIFEDVPMATPIEVFKLNRLCKESTDPNKVNLGVGAYRTEEGKPYLLPVVEKAENKMVIDKIPHEYLPVAGLEDFRTAACKLILGADSPALVNNRAEGVQCLGGTGCIRLAAEFYKNQLKCDTVYCSNPTWGNHRNIFKQAQFKNICAYRYWKAETRGLDLEGMLEDLRNAPEKSVVVLHAVAHNPTGVDPTVEQWDRIADVCQEKKMYVLLDNAYQGFASGDLDKDAYSSRLFVKRGFEFFIAQSFSKNFGLYNERIGNLCVVANDPSYISKIRSQLEILARVLWSNPPNHGARIVATVLSSSDLYKEWVGTVRHMAERIQAMRKLMKDKLKVKGTPGNWDHITSQIGMFCYTGLTVDQVTDLREKYSIFMLSEGRINMCGITTSNCDYVVNSIHDVVTKTDSCQKKA